ncbi:MAG: hypothetical protein GX491_02545 [Chloroflexi bacterium]|nr:hypothetical protein [Chloroflexota bacterium]
MSTPESSSITTSANEQPPAPAIEAPTRPIRYWQRRARFGLILTLFGYLVSLIGARPGMFGLDRSPIIGFVQIAVFLIGLAVICLGGFISLTALWREQPTSIAADIGLRLVATGYVIAVFAGMADIFGFGSHPLPTLPYFGEWQARGVEVGQAFIALGFLLLLPFRQDEKAPSSGKK